MNAEELHAIALALRFELREENTLGRVEDLVNALNSQVGNPGEPSYQTSVGVGLRELRFTLEAAQSNSFPPGWQQKLDDLGVGELFGARLLPKINEVFERNTITPSVALEELRAIAENLRHVDAAAEATVSGMIGFGIPAQELEPGDVEIGFLIPRRRVDNALADLGREFQQLDRILRPFVELATGSRPAMPIVSISSSEFGVLLQAGPEIGQIVSRAMSFLIARYKDVLEIRRLRTEIRDLDLPEEIATGLGEAADTRMGAAIGELVEQLIDEFGSNLSDEGREQEIKIDLKQSLTGLARRIDLGFHVEVRALPPEAPEPDADADSSEMMPPDQRYQAIADAAKALEFVNLEGDPILSLTEGETADDQGNTSRNEAGH